MNKTLISYVGLKMITKKRRRGIVEQWYLTIFRARFLLTNSIWVCQQISPLPIAAFLDYEDKE